MTLSLPTWQMGWGAFDLAIPGRGTVPRARPCGGSRRSTASPSSATKKNRAGERPPGGAQSSVSHTLADGGDAVPPKETFVGGAQSSAPYASPDRGDTVQPLPAPSHPRSTVAVLAHPMASTSALGC